MHPLAHLRRQNSSVPSCATSCLKSVQEKPVRPLPLPTTILSNTADVDQGSCAITDFACLCSDPNVTGFLGSCLEAECDVRLRSTSHASLMMMVGQESDLEIAIQYGEAFCASAGVSMSMTSSATLSSSSSSSASQSTGSSNSSGSVTVSTTTYSHSDGKAASTFLDAATSSVPIMFFDAVCDADLSASSSSSSAKSPVDDTMSSSTTSE